METYSAIDNALALVRRLREVAKNVREAEIRNALADLSIELAKAKAQIAQLTAENVTLKERLAMVEERRLAERPRPTIKWGCYKFEGEEGLYCPACYDTKGVKHLTTRLSATRRQCVVCRTEMGLS